MTTKLCPSMPFAGFSSFEICKAIYTSGILQQVKLTPTSKLVLIALANHYNPSKPDMFPSQKFIANQLGIGERSVARAIIELRQHCLIIYETSNVNRYRFTNIFFEQLNLAGETGQNDGQGYVKMANKQIKEKINNNPNGVFKNSFKSDPSSCFKKNNFYSNNQSKGVNYVPFKPEKAEWDHRSPYTDKKTAVNWLENIPENLKKERIIAEKIVKVRSIWNL